MVELQQAPHYTKRVSIVAWAVGGILGWAVMTGIGFTLWGVGEGVVALWNDPGQTIPVAYTPWPHSDEITRILAIAPAGGSDMRNP